MIDDKKIKSAAQGYCDTTYGTLNEHPLIAEAFEQGVNWAIQQFLKDLWHFPNEIPEIGRIFIMENHYCDGQSDGARYAHWMICATPPQGFINSQITNIKNYE